MPNTNAARVGIEHMAELLSLSQPANIFQFFLDCGRECQVQPLTFEEAKYICRIVRDLGGFRELQPQHCFVNAQRMMLKDFERRLEYCEGYVTGDRIKNLPIHHAWCSINQKVVDLTMRAVLKQEHSHEVQHYWGTPLPFKMLFRYLHEHGRHNPLTDPLRENVIAEFKWDGKPKGKKRGPKPKGEQIGQP